MRTQDEIVTQIKAQQGEDFFGFEVNEYSNWLDYAHAKEFLKPEVTEQQWIEKTKEVKTPIEVIKEYMPFAWEKANNCRGLSANRSIEHFIAWLWLDGKDWLRKEYEDHYEFYGKPQLVKICEEYGIDWEPLDDGYWRNNEHSRGITAQKALAVKS